jgi:hypothetical protein
MGSTPIVDCSKMKRLREQRELLMTDNAQASELDKVSAEIKDHEKFWHPHNCE